MKSVKKIMDEYGSGYPEMKLNLFLECPELRSDFIQMDMAKRSAKTPCSNLAENKKRRK